MYPVQVQQQQQPRYNYGNEQQLPPPRHDFGNEQRRREDYALYGNEEGHNDLSIDEQDQRPAQSRPQDAGAAAGGASGGGGGGGKPVMKSLCAKTGCSFKGYKDLKDLCPDCYVEEYSKYPDFYSPDLYPLVWAACKTTPLASH